MTEDFEYDEDKAISHIRAYLPIDIKDKYSDDDILIVIDTIFDYYESKGLFDISDDSEEEDINVPDMVQYVIVQLRKDKECPVLSSDVEAIVLGEIDYEESLGIY